MIWSISYHFTVELEDAPPFYCERADWVDGSFPDVIAYVDELVANGNTVDCCLVVDEAWLKG